MSHVLYHAESSARRLVESPKTTSSSILGLTKPRSCSETSVIGLFATIPTAFSKLNACSGSCSLMEHLPRLVAEMHVRQDCHNRIPSVQDWLEQIQPMSWMNRGYREDQ